MPAQMPVYLNRAGIREIATGSSRLRTVTAAVAVAVKTGAVAVAVAVAVAAAVRIAYLKLNFSSGMSVLTFLLVKSIRV